MRTQSDIQKALSELVSDCGYAPVKRALESVRVSIAATNGAADKKKTRPANPRTKPRVRKNAVAIVEGLAISDGDKKQALMILAEKYDAKTFMPSVGSARAFLQQDGMDVSRIKSRQQITAIVFKRLANKDADDLREMDSQGWYGPPKSLANIARAIENYGRQRRV